MIDLSKIKELNKGENDAITAAEKSKDNFEHEAGNRFNYQIGKLMQKHKIRHAVMVYHPGGEAFNKVEVVYVGDPTIDWILTAFENLSREMERRMEEGRILSGVRPMPESGN